MENIEPAITWKDLGYDRFMRRTPLARMTYTADDVDILFEDGAIDSRKIKNLTAETIVASTIETKVDIGSGAQGAFVRIDGPENRILIHDGSFNRILIGRQVGGF